MREGGKEIKGGAETAGRRRKRGPITLSICFSICASFNPPNHQLVTPQCTHTGMKREAEEAEEAEDG